MEKENLIVSNLEELEKVAKDITLLVPNKKFFGLIGDLGSGKTQFTKFFVKALGGSEDDVVSPTFTILNEYNALQFKIFHFDFYRLNHIEELEEIGYKDFFYSDNIVIAEWVDKFIEFIPENRVLLKFKIVSEEIRDITIFE